MTEQLTESVAESAAAYEALAEPSPVANEPATAAADPEAPAAITPAVEPPVDTAAPDGTAAPANDSVNETPAAIVPAPALDELLAVASLASIDAAAQASASDLAEYQALLGRALHPEPNDGVMLLRAGAKLGKQPADLARETNWAVREQRSLERQRAAEAWVSELADERDRLQREVDGLKAVVEAGGDKPFLLRLCMALVFSATKTLRRECKAAMGAYLRASGWRMATEHSWTRAVPDGQPRPMELGTQAFKSQLLEDLKTPAGAAIGAQIDEAFRIGGLPAQLPCNFEFFGPMDLR
ncbi:MAG: hypothetical protein JWO57_661 [Pseudonocardiales bacterium]|nr:hypothetical protein [Pseudonocardiales bacterium]